MKITVEPQTDKEKEIAKLLEELINSKLKFTEQEFFSHFIKFGTDGIKIDENLDIKLIDPYQ